MKKSIALICAITIVFSLAGCNLFDKPDNIVTEFCDAMKTLDYETMRGCFVSGQIDKIEDSVTNSDYDQLNDYMKTCVSKLSYQIESSEVNDGKGSVNVKFNYTDASPVITAVLADYLQKALAMALTGANEKASDQLFMTIFNEKVESVKTETAEATITFTCTKTDDGWRIDDIPNGVISVLMSNIDKAFDAWDDDEDGVDESSTEETEAVWHDVKRGESIELATVKISVVKCEEATALSSSEWSSTDAQTGTKFVIYTVNIENITKSPLNFNASDIMLYDNKERSFSLYEDALWYIDDSLQYEELSPNIVKTGKFVYNVPEDSEGYYFAVGKSGTNDSYRFFG